MCLSKKLICFQHCCSKSIFCREVPKECPICKEYIENFQLDPFEIPYPLVQAKENLCSIVVRPSVGDFLDYNISDDLHIGITDSHGIVVEYDKCGLIKNDNEKWRNCAAIQIIPSSWEMYWDEILNEMCIDSMWSASNYDENEFNCFNFIIAFLNNLNYKNFQFMNKEDICRVFILPKIESILKYASLCNQLKDKNFYIQD